METDQRSQIASVQTQYSHGNEYKQYDLKNPKWT